MSKEDFTNGYFRAALWSSTDEEGAPLDSQYTVEDFDEESRDEMTSVAAAFYYAHHHLWDDDTPDDVNAGIDLWLTQAGHGAGYWDGDYVYGDELTALAKKYMRNKDVCVGDDGKLYIL